MSIHQINLSAQKTLRDIALLWSGTGVAQFLTVIYTLVIARHLAPSSYGLFVAAYSVAGLSSFFFNWGFDSWLLRQGAITSSLSRLTGQILAVKSILGTLWSMSLFVVLPALVPEMFPASLVLVGALDTLCDGLFNTELASLNATRRSPIASGLLFISRGGRLVGAILLVLGGIQSPSQFALARLIATFIGFCLAIVIVTPDFLTPFSALSSIFRDSVPFTLSQLLSTVYIQADETMLALMLADKQMVGLYAPASGFVNSLFVILAAGFTVMVPILTQMQKAKAQLFAPTVKRMYLGYIALGVLLWVGLWAGSQLFIELLLGHAYSVTGGLLAILSPIVFFKCVGFASSAVLVAVGWQKYRLVAQGLSAGTNVFLNLWVIPRYGVWGVSYVYVVSELVLVTGYIWLVTKWFKSM